MGLDPDVMDDETWARRVNECFFGMETVGKMFFGDKKD
jgi:hypothetical protein